MKRDATRKVAVIGAPILPSESRFNASLSRYAAEHHWEFVCSLAASVTAFQLLARMECDGALIRLTTPEMARAARRLRIPVVNFSSWLADPGVPTVRRDDEARGRLCAEHLLSKGFRRFGILRVPGGAYIDRRRQGFVHEVAKAGFAGGLRDYVVHSSPLKAGERRFLRDWLATLKPPTGLFLTDDEGAPVLMEVCREAGQRIPQDVAVIGAACHVDAAMLCVPRLTSIEENEDQVAWSAAECLDQLMSGTPLKDAEITVPPRGIIAQESTNTTALEDREVACAVDFIRIHVATAINISDVSDHVAVSRATLERRFKGALGLSLHDFLLRERVDLAKEYLLARPPMSLDGIARRCGLSTRKNMNVVFKRIMGQLPAEWRRANRRADAR